MWGIFRGYGLAQLEVHLTAQLLKSPYLHRLARCAHRRIHKLKTGETLPQEIDRTALESFDDPYRKGFLSHFVDELKGQILRNPPKR